MWKSLNSNFAIFLDEIWQPYWRFPEDHKWYFLHNFTIYVLSNGMDSFIRNQLNCISDILLTRENQAKLCFETLWKFPLDYKESTYKIHRTIRLASTIFDVPSEASLRDKSWAYEGDPQNFDAGLNGEDKLTRDTGFERTFFEALRRFFERLFTLKSFDTNRGRFYLLITRLPSCSWFPWYNGTIIS